MNPTDTKTPPPVIWWTIWAATIAGLIVIAAAIRQPAPSQSPEALRFLPLAPLLVATVIRWLLLPRLSGARAFPVFVTGLAMAESTGIFAIFLVPDLKLEYLVMSIAGLAQFFPPHVHRQNG